MASVTLDPYLFFAGNANEAMEFYKGIFGGELTIAKYEDAPEVPEGMEGKVMNAQLQGGDVHFMASDSPYPDKIGSGQVSLSISGTDEAKLRGYFDKLSAGGKVTAPLKKEFWGDTFGMLTDKYGFDWMIDITVPK